MCWKILLITYLWMFELKIIDDRKKSSITLPFFCIALAIHFTPVNNQSHNLTNDIQSNPICDGAEYYGIDYEAITCDGNGQMCKIDSKINRGDNLQCTWDLEIFERTGMTNHKNKIVYVLNFFFNLLMICNKKKFQDVIHGEAKHIASVRVMTPI